MTAAIYRWVHGDIGGDIDIALAAWRQSTVRLRHRRSGVALHLRVLQWAGCPMARKQPSNKEHEKRR